MIPLQGKRWRIEHFPGGKNASLYGYRIGKPRLSAFKRPNQTTWKYSYGRAYIKLEMHIFAPAVIFSTNWGENMHFPLFFRPLSIIFWIFPSKSYVLDHSESIDLIIENYLKITFFLPYGRGGSESYGHARKVISFFMPSLKGKTNIKKSFLVVGPLRV